MESDLDDIKRLDFVLAKAEHVEDNYYTISDDDSFQSEDEVILDRDISIDSEDDIMQMSLNIGSKSSKVSKLYNLNAIKNYLTFEELDIIIMCSNPELQKLMILNRVKQIKLKNTRVHYSNLLQKCCKYIGEEEKKNLTNNSIPKIIKTPAIRLGYPYFKDKKGYITPVHDEIIKKRQNDEITPHYLANYTRWTLGDQFALKETVISQYKKIKGEQNKSTVVVKSNSSNSDVPPINFKGINWDRVSEEIGGRHSATSCKAFWQVYYHPEINKGSFCPEEIEKLPSLIQKYKCQDWDSIASELNTDRTGYSICGYYFSKIYPRYKSDRFTIEEDKRIRQLVEKYKVGNYIPWTKIALEFKNRRREQLYHRYKYLCNGHTMKGQFTYAEDILLFCLHNKFGKNYKAFIPYIPHRSDIQIRHRFVNYLEKLNLNFGNWTYNEDQKILEYVQQNGDKNWSQLTSVIPRNRYHIRQRYVALKNWMDKNPNKDIKDIRRRVHISCIGKNKKANMMKRIAMEFKDKIPTLEEIQNFIDNKEPFQVRLNRGDWFDNDVADVQLLEYFKSSHKINSTNTFGQKTHYQQCDHEIPQMVCEFLNAKLNIPSDAELTSYKCLDEVDLRILSKLRESFNVKSNETLNPTPSTSYNQNVNSGSTNKYVFPPTLATVIALRSMLIKYKSYKGTNCDRKNFTSQKLFREPSDDYSLYQDRLKTLFRWPCVMSLNQPSEVSKKTEVLNPASKLDQQKRPKLKKVRKEKIQYMMEAKKLKHQNSKKVQLTRHGNETPFVMEIVSSQEDKAAIVI